MIDPKEIAESLTAAEVRWLQAADTYTGAPDTDVGVGPFHLCLAKGMAAGHGWRFFATGLGREVLDAL